MQGLLPPAVAQRRDKMGFVTPEELWVRRDRPDGFHAALDAAADASQGVLTRDAVTLGHAMIDARSPFHNRLWRMISFGSWMKRFDVRVAA